MTNKRFKRYLLDGGFWFEEYVEPVWAITDRLDKNSPITHIEFKDEYKDLCDEVVKLLNELNDENENLKQANSQLAKVNREGVKKVQKLAKENEQLRHDATILIQSNQDYRKENQQLKEQLMDCEKFRHTVYQEISKEMSKHD